MEKSSQKDSKAQRKSPKINLNIGRIVWGLALVTVGVLAILNHYAVVSVNFSDVLCLFPLVLVLIGLSMLSIRNWLWASVVFLAILALFSAAIAISTGFLRIPGMQYSTDIKEIVIANQNNEAKILDVSVVNAIGNIDITSNNSSPLLTAKYSASDTVSQTSTLKDGTQTVDLNLAEKRGWLRMMPQNRLALALNESIATDLSLSTGAASLNADLSNIYLHKLRLKSGASSNTIKLGDKTDQVTVSLDTGMSSIEVLVPEGTGIRTDLESGISSTQMPEMHDTTEGMRETNGYKTAARKVDFEGKIGIANLKISYY
jgi:hypothetical protein